MKIRLLGGQGDMFYLCHSLLVYEIELTMQLEGVVLRFNCDDK